MKRNRTVRVWGKRAHGRRPGPWAGHKQHEGPFDWDTALRRAWAAVERDL